MYCKGKIMYAGLRILALQIRKRIPDLHLFIVKNAAKLKKYFSTEYLSRWLPIHWFEYGVSCIETDVH